MVKTFHAASRASSLSGSRRSMVFLQPNRTRESRHFRSRLSNSNGERYVPMTRAQHQTYVAASVDDSTSVGVEPSAHTPSASMADMSTRATDITYIGTERFDATRRKKHKNYQIKSIKKGVPDALSDPKGASSKQTLPSALHITRKFVCRSRQKNCRSPLAWVYSTSVILICVIFPLFSFSTDVSFFLLGRHPYNETAAYLEKAKNIVENDQSGEFLSDLIPKNSHETEHDDQKTKTRHSDHKTVRKPKRIGKREASDMELALQATLGKLETSTPKPDAPTTSAAAWRENNFNATGHEQACAPRNKLLLYMTSDEAWKQLHQSHHMMTAVFEPVFIIGSLPCLVLCMIARFVVIVTNHDDFLSAYFMNIIVMPLQLFTGALSVQAASHHVGKFGFECWKCVVDDNCTNVYEESWTSDAVNVMLLVSLLAKLIDGVAGGTVLFWVAHRIFQKRRHHASIWFEIARITLSVITLVLWMSVSALLVLTPALGLLRYVLLEQASGFDNRKVISYGILVLFIGGVASWVFSFAALFVYGSYKTYLYCRLREQDADVRTDDY